MKPVGYSISSKKQLSKNGNGLIYGSQTDNGSIKKPAHQE